MLQSRQHDPLCGMFRAQVIRMDPAGVSRNDAQRVDFGVDPLEGGAQGS